MGYDEKMRMLQSFSKQFLSQQSAASHLEQLHPFHLQKVHRQMEGLDIVWVLLWPLQRMLVWLLQCADCIAARS